jgi:hypothetical protein
MVQILKTPMVISASIMEGRGYTLDPKERDSDGILLEQRFRYQEAYSISTGSALCGTWHWSEWSFHGRR